MSNVWFGAPQFFKCPVCGEMVSAVAFEAHRIKETPELFRRTENKETIEEELQRQCTKSVENAETSWF